MTIEEWRLKKETDRQVRAYLEKARQSQFKEEQDKESVFTREIESLIDVDF